MEDLKEVLGELETLLSNIIDSDISLDKNASKDTLLEEIPKLQLDVLTSITQSVNLFKKISNTSNEEPDLLTDIVLKDIQVNSELPLSKQFVEFGLWKTINRLNLDTSKSFNRLNIVESSLDNMDIEQAQSQLESTAEDHFKDFYLTKLTEGFGEELNQLREEESFDGTRLEILIDSLQSTVNIFNNIEKELSLASFKQTKS
ncbi:hypothetical protein K7432_009095 [Basidiobolus ranarum]|uniref:Ribosome assembly protein 3 n=1 Tax=Basidiobolus ranarum TaxID=34480 RepID=A0ABR2WQV6_9FUNG